jgi:omega-amidase
MISSSLHITLVQPDIAWEKSQENFEHLDLLLSGSSGQDLIILPEMWSTGFSMRPELIAEPSDGPALQWMKAKAKQKNAVIAGSVSVKEDNQYFNRCYYAFPDGEVVSYNKRHLFSYGKEDQHYTTASEQVVVDIKGWKIKPVICYDLRFPVWCRNTEDYDLLVVVANWPIPRIHHWDALLKARAIENQSYVVAVNRIGTDGNGLEYNGHSSVYDMNGTQLVFLNEQEGLASIILDRHQLNTFREQFRFLQDRDHFTIQPQ